PAKRQSSAALRTLRAVSDRRIDAAGAAAWEVRADRDEAPLFDLARQVPDTLVLLLNGHDESSGVSRHGPDCRRRSSSYTATGATCRIRASTRSMTASGVDVPAVSPTTLARSNHSGRTSASVCT